MRKKILILGSFSKGALEHQYVRGFLNNNWEVEKLDIQISVHEQANLHIINKLTNRFFPDIFLASINKKAIEKAREINPLVVLIFKGMEIKAETILELKQHCKLVCNYNPDHPFKFYSRGAGNTNVLKGIPHYDIYFSYSKNIVNQLNNKFKVKSYCIPFGYDNQIKPVKFSEKNITDDFIFIGAWDMQREKDLTNLIDYPITLFGPTNWRNKLASNKEMLSKLSTHSLYEQDYANACFTAFGVLNFIRSQNLIEQSHNMRTFEVTGYGGLLISQRTEEQLDFFEEDKEAIYFDELGELKEKLNYLQNNPNKVAEIKLNAHQRSLSSGYDYNARTKALIEKLEKYV